MENYVELEPHFEKLKLDENYINYFYNFNRDNLRTYPDLVKEAIEKAHTICKENKYDSGCAWCLLSLGWYYHDRCMYDEAIDFHTRANDIFIQKNETKGISRSSNALLADYTAIGMLDLAIEHGLTGIGISEKYNDEESLIPLTINTAMAYLDSKFYKECVDLLKRLDNVWNKIEPEHLAIIYNALAEVEIKLENLSIADEYCQKACELMQEQNLIVIKNENLFIRAEINWKLGKYDDVEKDYQEALDLSIKYNNSSMILKILSSWSSYYSSIGNYEKAEQKLLKAIEEGKKVNSKFSVKEIYYQLSILYENMERYKDAYKAMSIFAQHEKEIFNHNSSLWFAKLHNKKITDEAKAYKVLYDEMKIISNIGQKITSNLKIENTLESIYKEVNLLVEADIFGIALYKEEIKRLDYELFIERGEKINYGLISVEEEDSFGAYCYNNKTDIVINDIYSEYKKYLKHELNKKDCKKNIAHSAIFSSLIVDDKVIGIISVQNYNKNAYSNNDLNKLKILTSYIAIALQNAKLFEKVEYLATHDSLTGVLNRSEILTIGKTNCVDELKEKKSSGIIMLDVDYFKSVNDRYGHLTGDYVLKEVAQTIKSQIRSTDYIGRYGGEEFLLLLPDTNIEEAKKIGERIRKSVEGKEYKFDNNQMYVTCSLGVCEINQYNNLSFYDAVKYADEALYKAKHSGRNCVVEYI